MAELDTVTIPELDNLTIALTSYFATSNLNGKLGKATISDLVAFIAPYVQGVGASGFIPVSGTSLPVSPANSFSLVGADTFTQTTGGNLVTTGVLNLIANGNGTTWSLIKAIDISSFLVKSNILGVTGDLSSYSTPITTDYTQGPNIAMIADGKISSITFWGARAGAIKFKVMRPKTSTNWDLITETTYTATTGNNTVTVNLDVKKGDFLTIHVSSSTGSIGYKLTTGGIGLVQSNGDVTGNADFAINSAASYGINFTLKADVYASIDSISTDLASFKTSFNSQIDVLTNKVSGVFRSNSKVIVSQKFYDTVLPSPFVQAGGWIPGITGLQSPATGGWGAYVYWNKRIVLDKDETTVKVKVNASNSIFSIARLSDQDLGTVLEADFSTSTLKLYSVLTSIGATPSSVIQYLPMTVTYVSGREYYLGIKKVSETYYFTITDSVTSATDSITFVSTGTATNIGKAWNFPGVIFRQGNVNVLEINYTNGMPKNPTATVVGDSVTEGDTIRNVANGGYTKRWAGLLETALNGNISIIARAGENSTDVNGKLQVIGSVINKPQCVIYAIGTNDDTFATWLANMTAFKAMVESKGAELILTTLYPRDGREAFCTQVTNYVLKSTSRYIDFAKALTVNGDRVNRDSSLILADLLHPNVAGHAKMFNQIKIDLPDLF